MFRLTTPLIVLDLEATAGQDDQGYQTNNCILDVGAVYLDETLEVRGEVSSLVRPEEPVTPFITQLTGITPEMVAGEKAFDEPLRVSPVGLEGRLA